MTTNPTDPNQVRMTGENSFIRLQLEPGGPQITRISHWRVLYSPVGPGHALFLKSDVVDDEVLVYADNIALALRGDYGAGHALQGWRQRVRRRYLPLQRTNHQPLPRPRGKWAARLRQPERRLPLEAGLVPS